MASPSLSSSPHPSSSSPSSSPQVSRSYSYPLEAPWHPANASTLDSRKGSLDLNDKNNASNLSSNNININITSPSGRTMEEGRRESTDMNNDENNNESIENNNNNSSSHEANTSSSDMLVPPKLKPNKSSAEERRASMEGNNREGSRSSLSGGEGNKSEGEGGGGGGTIKTTPRSRMWRQSGNGLQQKLAGWKVDQPLDLSHLNLDVFPKPLYKGDTFLSLQELNLSSNKLTSLPPQINLLKALTSLDCTFNRLSDLPVELGELQSLETLNLSGNPLNKDLMQKHLLGTAAVLQYLRDRQTAEARQLRRSKFPRVLKNSSDPTNNSSPPPQTTHSLPPSTSISTITPPASLISRHPLASSDPSHPPLQRHRGTPPHTPPHPILSDKPSSPQPPLNASQTLAVSGSLSGSVSASHTGSLSSSPVPPPQNRSPSPQPPTSTTPPPEPPRGDMGPIVAQLKLGIVYAETVIKTPPPLSSSLAPPEIPRHRKTPSHNNMESLTGALHNLSKEKYTITGDGRFTFNSYCSASFVELRNLASVPQERYLAALDSISALGFAGKSGAVLLKSADNLLVLKTISKDEGKFLRKIMPQYLAYMKSNPKTYLTRFWGLYKVIRSPIEKANFVVMKNAFNTSKKIHERYDLKGSTVGRTTDEENVRRSRIVLKDLNFNRSLKLGEERGKTFLTQLEKDIEFLQKFEIIDYSLIVGVHYLSEAPTRDPNQEYPVEGEIQAIDKDDQLLDEIYFLNIIDMLQPYNMRKQMEYNIKSIRYGPGISVVPPVNYANRFLNFIHSVVE